MNKCATFFLIAILLLFSSPGVAEDTSLEVKEIDYVYMEGCPACIQFEAFLEDYKEDKNLTVNYYDSTDPEITQKIHELEENHSVEADRLVTPMIFIDGNLLTGWGESTEREFRQLVEGSEIDGAEDTSEVGELIPFVSDDFEASDLSLPVLAAVLGLIDGMNVCSIGALLLILGIVVKFDSRKKIFAYGGLFLLTTVVVYGTLVFAWYGAMNYIAAYIGIMEVIIGLAGVIGGSYLFYQFTRFYRYGPTCDTLGGNITSKYSSKVRERLEEDGKKGLLGVAAAITMFAAIITIVELPCSVAIPLVFTGVLAEHALSTTAFAGYIVLYLFMYMMIELIVFTFAVLTKDLWYGPDRAVTWSTLLASLILFGLGIYYLPFLF